MKRALAALVILATLAAAAALAALSRPTGLPAGRPDSPVRIGVSLGLTGRFAETSRLQEQGFQLWAWRQNLAGGLHGRTVELLVRNDGGDREATRRIYQDFISRDRVDFLFSPYSSELTAVVSALAAQHGYPLLASGAAADPLWDAGNPLLFGMLVPASRYTQGFLELMLQNGVTRLALLCFPGMFPEEVCRGARAWADRLGIAIVFSRLVSGPDPALAEAVVEARASGAEAVLICSYARDSMAARRAVHASGWRPRAVFSTVGPSLHSYDDALGEISEGDFTASLWEPELPYPGAAEFSREFAEKFGQPANYHAAAAFAAGQVLAQAVDKAGSTDRRRVAEAMAKLDSTTILGHFAVDRRGMQLRHFPVVIQWQGKHKAVVWPRELATAEPRLAPLQ